MYQRLFIGNKVVNLKEVDSTNAYMKQLVAGNKEIEGLVVVAQNQQEGRGQKGNVWKSKKGKNLTFSIFLKPNLLVQNQFLISKVISLGIIHFLENLGVDNLKIKWPNDIYCSDRKISGILIENAIKENKIYNSIVGIGLNVNQNEFDLKQQPSSIVNELGCDTLDLDELLNQLLFFIEKQYMRLKTGKEELIHQDYIHYLYWMNESRNFKIDNKSITGTIIGVNAIGQLQVKIDNEIKTFDLKEIAFFGK